MKKAVLFQKDFKIVPLIRNKGKRLGTVQRRNGDKIKNAQENIYPDDHGGKVKEPGRSPLRISCAVYGGQPISVLAVWSIGRNKATILKAPQL